MHKKVAILQSNYIPWKGYFDIINSVDEFIIYDEVQYTVNDWRNRNKIKTSQGEMWLTIPVKSRNHLGKKINEIFVANQIWRKKHFNSICHNYSKAKYFKQYSELFENIYLNCDDENLGKINLTFIKLINEILGISTLISDSGEYSIGEGQTKRLVNMCQQAGASDYISGPSAKNYIDEKLFLEEGIDISYYDYSDYQPYEQLYDGFIHSVSIIDLIFNKGPDAKMYMKSFS